LPPIKEYTPEPVLAPDIESVRDRSVNISRRDDGAYVVEGEWLLRFLRGVNMDDYDSLQYFQRILQTSGVIDSLRNAGVTDGDTVSIFDFEFDFVE
ncbi:MAG TPA: GTPase CgtA, partial [Ruminococcaceae bacterium]|nr:GTPase CgtA [Oscillospiraceae bacterium]